MKVLAWLLPIQTGLCTSRLVALLVLSLANLSPSEKFNIEQGFVTVIILAIVSVISLTLMIIYMEYVISPLPSNNKIGASDYKWLYLLCFLPGVQLFIQVQLVMDVGSDYSYTVLGILYSFLRGVPFVIILLMLRKTFLYRRGLQIRLEICSAFFGAAAVCEAKFRNLDENPIVMASCIVIIAFSLILSIILSLRTASEIDLPPTSLRNVLKIAYTSLSILDSGFIDLNATIYLYMFAKNPTIQLSSRQDQHNGGTFLASRRPREPQQPEEKQGPTVQDLCFSMLHLPFLALLQKSKDTLHELIYLSLVCRHGKGYGRTAVLISRLKGSCRGVKSGIMLRKVLGLGRSSDASINQYVSPSSLASSHEARSYDCGHLRTNRNSAGVSSDGKFQLLEDLVFLQLFDSLLAQMITQTKLVNNFFSALSSSTSTPSHLHTFSSLSSTARSQHHSLFSLLQSQSLSTSFHLIPYAQYCLLVYNEYRLSREIIKEGIRRERVSKRSEGWWDGGGIKETSVVYKASSEASCMGRILYASRNRTVLECQTTGSSINTTTSKIDIMEDIRLTIDTKPAQKTNNIFDFLFPSLRTPHLDLISNFMHEADSDYLGKPQNRYIQIPHSSISKKAKVTVTLGICLEDGLSFILGLDIEKQDRMYMVIDHSHSLISASQKLSLFCPHLPPLQTISPQIKEILAASADRPLLADKETSLNLIDAADQNRVGTSPQLTYQRLDSGKSRDQLTTVSPPLLAVSKIDERVVLNFGKNRQYRASLKDIKLQRVNLRNSPSTPVYIVTFEDHIFMPSNERKVNLGFVKRISNICGHFERDFVEEVEIEMEDKKMLTRLPAKPYQLHEQTFSSDDTNAIQNPQRTQTKQDNERLAGKPGRKSKESVRADICSVTSIQKRDVERMVALNLVSPTKMIAKPLILLSAIIVAHIASIVAVFYLLDLTLGEAQDRLIFNLLSLKNTVFMYSKELQIMGAIRQKMIFQAGLQTPSKYSFLIPGNSISPDEEIESIFADAVQEYNTFFRIFRSFDQSTRNLVNFYTFQATIPGNFTSSRLKTKRRKITTANLPLEANALYSTLISSLPNVSFNSAEYAISTSFIAASTAKTSIPLYDAIAYQQIDNFTLKIKSTNFVAIAIFCFAELLSMLIVLISYFIRFRIFSIYSVFSNLEEQEIVHKVGATAVLLEYFKQLRDRSIFTSFSFYAQSMSLRNFVQSGDRVRTKKAVMLRVKGSASIQSKLYFFNLKRIICALLIMFHISIGVMVGRMVSFSNRRQVLNEILFNFRFVTKSCFLLILVEHSMTDLLLSKAGALSFPPVPEQIKKTAGILAALDESNTIIRRHYEKISPEESEYFFNFGQKGDLCSLANVESSSGLTLQRCRSMAQGIMSKPLVSLFDYYRVMIFDLVTRMRESADPQSARSILQEQQWVELQFVVAKMIIPLYGGYSTSFTASLDDYQSADSDTAWTKIYLLQSTLYIIALALFIYFCYTLSSHSAICFQSIKLLPSPAISNNAYVKVRLKSLEDKLA